MPSNKIVSKTTLVAIFAVRLASNMFIPGIKPYGPGLHVRLFAKSINRLFCPHLLGTDAITLAFGIRRQNLDGDYVRLTFLGVGH